MASPLLDLTRDDDAHMAARLSAEPLIWIGTTRPDGRPHHVPVWFLWDDPTILIFSGDNLKVRNLEKNPAVWLSLDTAAGGNDIVLIDGDAELLDRSDVSAATTPGFVRKYDPLMSQMSFEVWARMFPQPILVSVTKIMGW